MVKAWQVVRDGKRVPGLADTQNRKHHAQLKRPIANTYSMSNLHNSEPFVDNTIKYFLKRLDEEFVGKESPCDIDNWLQYCAYFLHIASSKMEASETS